MFVCLYYSSYVFLVAAIFVIKRQMRRAQDARKLAQRANVRLKELNRELSESSRIKEEYIAHYIDQCSLYIEKWTNIENIFRKLQLRVV